nr:D-amino acid dehydrogenase small subunit [Kibdelosporangium sp. MJ126-NF4]CTQ97292.1 D-amino acid dehydrogenase small subunit (EC 1.4.99.1) [Kibdelosporangium sp. MJ126-NF4]
MIHRPDLVTASDEVVALAIDELKPDAVVRPDGDVDAALAAAERDIADRVPVPMGTTGDKVVVVGAGIVNLVSALTLARSGYQVEVYDRSPDPRADADWTAYGCTRGGGDGRMFTLTEADSYNSRSWPGGDLLTRSITDHGWLVAKPGGLSAAELEWADEFHRIPPWLADSYTQDIFDANRTAGEGWDRLMASDPDLFDGLRDGIVRLYTDDDYYRWHVDRNQRLGATRKVLTPEQVRTGYPALVDAPVAGGIEVVGFTVNIHSFLARLVDLLVAEGVRFQWDTPVSGIHWASPGVPDGVLTPSTVLRGDHYVLSPGAYGEELVRGTASHGQIMGMLGVWLTVPNVEPRLDHSVKIARKGHRAEETNVTLGTGPDGEPILICGAGYGWTGTDPGNIDSTELEMLFDALADTIRQFFPKAYAAARKAGTLAASRRLCVRPWTSSCLGVFETIETAGSGTLVVTGGHNTGGFTQSPAVADAVLAALQGRQHAMHTRFHPLRLRRFYSAGDGDSLRITS